MNFNYNVTPEMIREKYYEMYEHVLKQKNQGAQEPDDDLYELLHELIPLLVSYFDTPFHRLQEIEIVNSLNAPEMLACMRIAYELNRNGFLSIPNGGDDIVKKAYEMYDAFIEEFAVVSYKGKRSEGDERDE